MDVEQLVAFAGEQKIEADRRLSDLIAETTGLPRLEWRVDQSEQAPNGDVDLSGSLDVTSDDEEESYKRAVTIIMGYADALGLGEFSNADGSCFACAREVKAPGGTVSSVFVDIKYVSDEVMHEITEEWFSSPDFDPSQVKTQTFDEMHRELAVTWREMLKAA